MKRELTKYLNSLSDKELIKEVKKLYDKFDVVKKYYELELGDDSEKILKDFKDQIKKEYFPSRGYGHARSSVSKKVVTEFKKISVHQKDVIELLLYRVEVMLEFTNQYGDIDGSFYSSLENSFEQACKLIRKEKLESHFKNYCQELVSQTIHLGWGVSYNMRDVYQRYFQ